MYQPAIQVRSNGLVKYDVWMGESSHKRYNIRESERLPYNGEFSNHARKRLISAIDILIQRNPTKIIYNPISETSHEFNINFITLTVASKINITARQGYDELLSKWLRYMRDKYDLREYVWKAEFQQRGQVHYHVAGNEFIPWQVIRWKWNNLQKKAGLLNDFAREHGHFNPNSTDIHKIEKDQDTLNYISKEIGKNSFEGCKNGYKVCEIYFDKKEKLYVGYVEDGAGSDRWLYMDWNPDLTPHSWDDPAYTLVPAKMEGKIWDASERLKVSRFAELMDTETCNRIGNAIREGKVRRLSMERCDIIKTQKPLELLSNSFLKKYQEYIVN